MHRSLLLLALLLLVPGCQPGVTPVLYDWSILEQGPRQDFWYRYAGSAVEDEGRRYLFTCANVDRSDRFVVTDHIVMRKAERDLESGAWEYGEEHVALWPGEVDASGQVPCDFEHVCDPEVVAGSFHYQRPGEAEPEEFRYALFYLGIQGVPDYLDGIPDGHVNQIGWALAQSLDGPWHKVGDAPLITSDAAGFWGVGQPSATSLDRKGEVLLFYTRGEADGTRTFRQRLSLRDANRPVLHGERALPTAGLRLSDGSPDPLNHGGAFVFDEEAGRYYVIRDGHPHPASCPDFIADRLEVAYLTSDEVHSGSGTWKPVTRLSGFAPRIFDGGWVRDRFGRLVERHVLEALVSVSFPEAGCPPFAGLWSYRVHGARIPKPGSRAPSPGDGEPSGEP